MDEESSTVAQISKNLWQCSVYLLRCGRSPAVDSIYSLLLECNHNLLTNRTKYKIQTTNYKVDIWNDSIEHHVGEKTGNSLEWEQ
jgi:hypothetical protein